SIPSPVILYPSLHPRGEAQEVVPRRNDNNALVARPPVARRTNHLAAAVLDHLLQLLLHNAIGHREEEALALERRREAAQTALLVLVQPEARLARRVHVLR
ncbi:hypothetical protein DQ04_27961000, partial [Trypanosoma grayi]|uniref:hypothetical protein n=1 Tax=Trypanosoma grayi TaxID=71804 RepID=UPI0004F413FF